MTIQDHQGLVAQLVNGNTLVRPVGHATATGAIVLSWIHALGDVAGVIATFMAICWYAVTLYETKTVQDMITRWKAQKILGPKMAAHRDAVNKVIVAVDAVKKAEELPVTPADESAPKI